MAYVLVFFYFKNILVISVRPIISTSTGLVFMKFAGLVELWPETNALKLFFDLSRDVAVATNFVGKIDFRTHFVVRVTFSRTALPAYDKKGSCYAGRRLTNCLTGWM